jgi:hypothetical protein
MLFSAGERLCSKGAVFRRGKAGGIAGAVMKKANYSFLSLILLGRSEATRALVVSSSYH